MSRIHAASIVLWLFTVFCVYKCTDEVSESAKARKIREENCLKMQCGELYHPTFTTSGHPECTCAPGPEPK